MLTAGARAPTSRFNRALIGLAAVLVFTVVFFALRCDPSAPAPAAPEPPAFLSQGEFATHAETEVPSVPSAERPRARARPTAAPAPEEEQEALTPADVTDPALKAVLSARTDLSAKGTKALIDNLTSSDEVVVAEAAKALVARRATEAIVPLAKISLENAAGSGLSIIDALGKLGGVAEGDPKSAAVERLLQMLREEKRRRARESPGNLLQIYEALGETRDPSAAPALEAELLDANVPRAPKVVVVQAVVNIGLASSRDALATAHAEQAAQKGADALDEEIRQELVAAIEQALEGL